MRVGSIKSLAIMAPQVCCPINPRTHMRKDLGQSQHEMPSPGYGNKGLWFIGAFKQALRQGYRDDAVVATVNNKRRDFDVANREVRAKLVEHEPPHGKNGEMSRGGVGRR